MEREHGETDHRQCGAQLDRISTAGVDDDVGVAPCQLADFGTQCLARFLYAGDCRLNLRLTTNSGPEIRTRLLVSIDQQHVFAGARAHGGEIECECGFTHPALFAADQYQHGVFAPADTNAIHF